MVTFTFFELYQAIAQVGLPSSFIFKIAAKKWKRRCYTNGLICAARPVFDCENNNKTLPITLII